jgi:CheY-like chemotaxis protein
MVPKRVLIIDDEADVRAVVRCCLEDVAGWDVVVAASGDEGLQQVAIDPPDAILLDVMMPGMDGLAFLRVLRTQPTECHLPVVLLTAKSSIAQSPQIAEFDVKGVISKPFDPFQLVEQFADFLGWQLEPSID